MSTDGENRRTIGGSSLREVMKEAEGLAQARVVDRIPMPDLTALRRSQNPAEWMHERLGKYIKEFEAGLDDEHEIGAHLVSFGQNISFHIQEVGYYGPDIISFTGLDQDGRRVNLIQHISQLSVLLVAMKKLDARPRRIGFIWDDEKGESSQG